MKARHHITRVALYREVNTVVMFKPPKEGELTDERRIDDGGKYQLKMHLNINTKIPFSNVPRFLLEIWIQCDTTADNTYYRVFHIHSSLTGTPSQNVVLNLI